jgi:hypothetical protein
MENDNYDLQDACDNCNFPGELVELERRIEKVLDLAQVAELLDDRYSDNRIRRNALREVVKLLKEPK